MSAFLHQPGTSRESAAQTQGHGQQGEASVLNGRALRPPASQGGEPGPTMVALSSSVCPEGPVPGPGSKEVQAPSQDHVAEQSKPPPPRAPGPPRQGIRALPTPHPMPWVLLLGLGNRPVLGEKSQ